MLLNNSIFHTLKCQENSVFSILYRNLTTSAVIEILDNIKKLNELNGFPTGKDDYIFLRQYKGNIEMCTPRCFDTRLRSYCHKANMDKAKSCHDIRRTTLTNLYKKGVPLKTIQYIACHSSLRQTMVYLKITDEDLDNMGDYFELISVN
ncbi:MAG: phage integrase family protein [Lachnospiraceae bacterium]|nr:phage integrase family protein [Lachnospiraceae bacterium]